ncbi:uncharacterized protein DNG_01306 [Cephalotrichum gorgonifer]|uniref:Extracellular serine-rich protein n=1 Tax=Cephalotrichum gorgonifer TaxID=2041049 RepID=A0AAE8MSU4_9PEZI|nr:uncharacterized protein DNG_01306 [Cephalotrichum gorgonifer]
MLRHLAVALCVVAGAVAQGTPTSTAPSATHTVHVGRSGFKFSPNTTVAAAGDVVEFKFYPPDHSIIRANYEHGCIPYEMVGINQVGFYDGPHILSGIAEDAPVYRLKINDTEPIFYYCGAPGSCMDKHMIGVVNPNDTMTLEGHLKYVEEAEFELIPGQDWPSESDNPNNADDADKDKDKDKGDTDGAADSSNSNSNSGSSSGSKLSPGAIAGIAIGGTALVVIIAGLIYLCGRRGGIDVGYRRSLRGPWGSGGGAPDGVGAPFVAGAGVGAVAGEQKSVTPMSMGWSQGSPPLGSPPMPSPGYASPGQQHYPSPMTASWTGTASEGDHRGVSYIGTTPPAPEPAAIPVELPASADPGNSPLPTYREMWSQGTEPHQRQTK